MIARLWCRLRGHREPFADRYVSGQLSWVCTRCWEVLNP